jgi:N-acetylneuraminic acid mutarotase
MKILFPTLLVSLLLLGAASFAQEQTPAVNHNTWTSGAAMPTARLGAAAGAIGSNIYVVDGHNVSSFLGVNEIYNTKKNTWTTGASDPNPRGFVAYAMVNKILYVFGGSNGSEVHYFSTFTRRHIGAARTRDTSPAAISNCTS